MAAGPEKLEMDLLVMQQPPLYVRNIYAENQTDTGVPDLSSIYGPPMNFVN